MSSSRRGGRRRRQQNNDEDDEERLEYGVRRARREVAWEYRDSSSLSSHEMMERRMNYRIAESMLEFSSHALLIITSLFVRMRIFDALIKMWSARGDIMSDAISYCRDVIGRFQDTILGLQWLWRYCRYYGEVALLYADDLTYFVRRRHRFRPESNRTMDAISRRDCYTWFGILPDQLRMLHLHWRIPERLQAPNSRHQFDGEACFIICLFHMVKGTTFIDMSQQYFGGNPRYMSWMHAAMIDHLYNTFYHKISGGSLEQWIPSHLDQCRRLIHAKVSNGFIQEERYVNGEVVDADWIHINFDPDRFRVVGFLDDLALETARPGDEARRREDLHHDIQRAFYSGYFRKHGLKAQVVVSILCILGIRVILLSAHSHTMIVLVFTNWNYSISIYHRNQAK